jgi:hypothetical protein
MLAVGGRRVQRRRSLGLCERAGLERELVA